MEVTGKEEEEAMEVVGERNSVVTPVKNGMGN